MHCECELAVVIGRVARKVKAAQAMDHVAASAAGMGLVASHRTMPAAPLLEMQ